jgi:CII-binding regulator of phage lambda lysogenization HflD
MTNDKIDQFILTFSEQILTLEQNQAQMRASLTVLKALAAMQIDPGDPIKGANQILDLEKKLESADPSNQERTRVTQLIEAAKLWKKHGGKNDA